MVGMIVIGRWGGYGLGGGGLGLVDGEVVIGR